LFIVCFRFLFVFLSPLVWFFLWLPEEVLALLFLLHCENGGFSILMKDIYISQEIPFFHDAIFFILVMEVLCR
jgi:hypothetical protein